MLNQGLVCLYADDSGQQSQGRFFVVAGLAVEHARSDVSDALCEAEEMSGKGRYRDWHGTSSRRRVAFLDCVSKTPLVRGRIFYKVYRNTTSDHMLLRADAAQAAIAAFAPRNRRAIFYEGLTRPNRDSLKRELRRRGLQSEVRTALWDKHPEVRLADTLAAMIGKVMFSTDGAEYAEFLCEWFAPL